MPVRTRSDPNCPFCSYTDRDVLVAEDEHCYAVVSTNPINRYHILVLPLAHYTALTDIPDEVGASLGRMARTLSRAVRNVAQPDAITHVSEDDFVGEFNLQAHTKIHIIPRYRTDLHLIDWSPLRKSASDHERGLLATEIRNELQNGDL